MISQYKFNLAFIDNLSAAYPQLAMAIGMPVKPSGNELPLEPENLKSLRDLDEIVETQYVIDAIAKSTEIKQLKHMIIAARFNKKSNYFDLFDPEGSGELGLGYGPRLKISESAINVLKIQKQSTKATIGSNVFSIINNYNDALNGCKAAEEGLEYIEDVRASVEENVEDHEKAFDITAASRYFQTVIDAALRYSTSYFLYKVAQANLDRLTWAGEYYKVVTDYIENDLEFDYHEVAKKHRFSKRIFNFFRSKHEKQEEVEISCIPDECIFADL